MKGNRKSEEKKKIDLISLKKRFFYHFIHIVIIVDTNIFLCKTIIWNDITDFFNSHLLPLLISLVFLSYSCKRDNTSITIINNCFKSFVELYDN